LKGVSDLSIFYAILLGLIQGLTEFLPVSSSGHLVAFQQIFNIQGASMAFDVVLHLGTLVAVFAFYWQDIMAMIRELFLWIGELIGINKSRYRWYDNEHRVMMVMLILATIPTAIIGFLFNDIFEKLFSSLRVVGFALLITGAILWLSNMMAKGRKEAKDIRATDAITIGLLQGLAITPGISRSGTTIFASMLRGFNVELATKFSFLLSIPFQD
jgi:undecaprenyl-diphosphatase